MLPTNYNFRILEKKLQPLNSDSFKSMNIRFYIKIIITYVLIFQENVLNRIKYLNFLVIKTCNLNMR